MASRTGLTRVRVKTDPKNWFAETNNTNNDTSSNIRITGNTVTKAWKNAATIRRMLNSLRAYRVPRISADLVSNADDAAVVLDAHWRVHPQWVSLAGASERVHKVVSRGSHRGPEEEGRRMGCLLALATGFAPRVALALVWIFTNLVDRAFNGFLIPLLGLIVFPYATLFYVLAYSPVSGGVGGWGWIFVVLGFVFDIGHWVGGGVTGRQRYASA